MALAREVAAACLLCFASCESRVRDDKRGKRSSPLVSRRFFLPPTDLARIDCRLDGTLIRALVSLSSCVWIRSLELMPRPLLFSADVHLRILATLAPCVVLFLASLIPSHPFSLTLSLADPCYAVISRGDGSTRHDEERERERGMTPRELWRELLARLLLRQCIHTCSLTLSPALPSLLASCLSFSLHLSVSVAP